MKNALGSNHLETAISQIIYGMINENEKNLEEGYNLIKNIPAEENNSWILEAKFYYFRGLVELQKFQEAYDYFSKLDEEILHF